MPRFKKGSKEAKAYMAKIRGKKATAKPVKKSAPKKTAVKKVSPFKSITKNLSGLDSVKRKGRKTQVNYSRVSGINEPKYIGPYKVVRVWFNKPTKTILEKDLTERQAQKIVQSYPDNDSYVVVYTKQYPTLKKYYK